jgi:cyclomaltodextrinase / maltogenic alpha-amylase / neopullulanase
MGQPYFERQHRDQSTYAAREADWRNGSIVYQVIVDRFAEPEDLAGKQHLYPHPKRVRTWAELPTRGEFLPEVNVWSHEVDFWGGDLNSLRSRLDYLSELDIDILYLNPIHAAFTNHKYDAYDYREISPEYGSQADLANLIRAAHDRKMKIVLDGVFNHMGRNSKLFTQAASSPDNVYRDWFYIDEKYPQGVRLWANAPSLPELNYENPAVTRFIYSSPDSVVRSYLRLGIDGWRLDTAFELGYQFLWELTQNAHLEKPGSLVVGEIWNYPKDWFPALDGVMNFTLRQIILDSLQGKISPAVASQMLAKMIEESGIEAMLKSWVLIDNHDVVRTKTLLPDPRDQKLAQVLQFTLPGSPNLYYGSELGMDGGEDPANRAPMQWDLVNAKNETLGWIKELIQLRKAHRALKIGDYRPAVADKLIAFERYTDCIDEALIVVVNPTDDVVHESILIPDSKLMNFTELVELLTHTPVARLTSALITVELAPKSAYILKPTTGSVGGYSPYKRID